MITTRQTAILNQCQAKKVLHLGFVQHEIIWRDKIKTGEWLHEKIVEMASQCVGIDLLADEIKKIKALYPHYDLRFGDATDLPSVKPKLETFDIIICGELIEHVSNQGSLLDSIATVMNSNSKLIITTPNPWRMLWIEKMRKSNNEFIWLNREHVLWHTKGTLTQLLKRHNFKITKADYYKYDSDVVKNNFKSRFKQLIDNKFGLFSAEPFNAEGLYFEAKI